MQMWACGSSCGADFADGLAFFNELSIFYGNFGKMKVHGMQPNAMIKDDSLSREKVIGR